MNYMSHHLISPARLDAGPARRRPRRYRSAALLLLGPAALLAGACGRRATAAAASAVTDSSAKARGKLSGSSNPSDRSARESTSVAPTVAAGTAGAASMDTMTLSQTQIQHGNVQWSRASAGRDTRSTVLPGQIVPNEDLTARLGAPASGRIVDVRVRPGERIARGQLLVTIQSPEAIAAQANVAKARAGVTALTARAAYADAARKRAERLLAISAIPRQDYDRAIADDEEVHASLDQARSELQRAETTARQLGASDQSAAGQFLIRSPIAGVVLSRSAVPGAVVDAGAPLVAITTPSQLWMSIAAPEQFAALFRIGAPLRFTVPAYPADTFTARVDAVGAGLDPETRTLAVRGTVQNRGERLKPAMLASVLVQMVEPTPVALVPQDAVQIVDGSPTVFLAEPNGTGGVRLARRTVQVGSRTGDRITVTRGLRPGDTIVTGGTIAVVAEFRKATTSPEPD